MNNFVKFWRDYRGEDIVKSVTYENGQQVIDKIRYHNLPFTVEHNGIAIVLGNGPSRNKLTVSDYANNNGGLRNKYKATVYGCNAVYRDGDVNHLIINNWNLLQSALSAKVYNRSKIYTHHSYWLKANDPEHVNLVPQKIIADTGTMALYLACFQGHKTVYFTGFDADNHPTDNIYEGTDEYASQQSVDADKIIASQFEIMNIYKDVEFIRVVPRQGMSARTSWTKLKNFSEIDFVKFIDLADIGLVVYENGYQQTRGPRRY